MKIADYAHGFFPGRPFHTNENCHVAFSGGRSSAAMLRLLLDHYGGTLPPNYKVIFCNTGKEVEETYTFIKAVEDNWQVEVIWLELDRFIADKAITVKRVDFHTASRIGEPFFKVLEQKAGFPPQRSARLCTQYMKVLTANTYLEEQGWHAGVKCIGYRADETKRLHTSRLRCGKNDEPWFPEAPLAYAGISRSNVLDFWKAQPFNLQLFGDVHGNCDLCFLKDMGKLQKIIQQYPERASWWIEAEAYLSERNGKDTWMLPHGGYKGLVERTLDGEVDTWDGQDLECSCTD